MAPSSSSLSFFFFFLTLRSSFYIYKFLCSFLSLSLFPLCFFFMTSLQFKVYSPCISNVTKHPSPTTTTTNAHHPFIYITASISNIFFYFPVIYTFLDRIPFFL
ncbi:uncharacterized protein BX664DRAFT_329060, partial [Halteromyces radiatus]|uniref:uncharacterized protein n=1 Tax=Halteromyces radiatus TaxID=101107 RepID=UPI0022207C38